MESKFSFSTAALLCLIILTFTSKAQPGRPYPPHGLRQVSTFNGIVGELWYNDDYVYDGFYLQVNGETLFVKFPRHMGTQIVPVLKKGNSITVNGIIHYSPHGEKEIRMVNIVVNGTTIYEMPPMEPRIRPFINEELISGSGKIIGLQINKSGSLHGLVLDNKTILRIPPHNAYQLSQLVTPGETISFTGGVKPVAEGEVVHEKYTIVHCNTIALNGTQYLVR